MYVLPKDIFDFNLYKNKDNLLLEKIKEWNSRIEDNNKINLYIINKKVISKKNRNIICRYANEFKKIYCCKNFCCFRNFLKLNRLYKFMYNNAYITNNLQYISILDQESIKIKKSNFVIFENCCEHILEDLELLTKIYTSITNNYYNFCFKDKKRYHYKNISNLEDLCKHIKYLEYLYKKYKNTNFVKIFKSDNWVVVKKFKGEYYFRIIF